MEKSVKSTMRRGYLELDENQNIVFENEVLPVFYKDKNDIMGEIQKLV